MSKRLGAATLDRLLGLIPLVAVAILAVAFAMEGWQGSYFSPDSYSYYELSRSVFEDFYRIDTVRSFGSESEFGNSFPPGWPVLIAFGDLVIDPGVRTGLVLNVLLVLLAGWLAERLMARHAGIRGLGALTVVAMCGLGFFADEVVSGRSMPATLVLLLLLLLQLPVDASSRRSMAILGAVLAGLALIRFDWLLPAMLLPAAFYAVGRRRRLAALLTGYATIAAVLMPWVIYSLLHFGTPFATDNSRVALNTESQHVTDYLPDPVTALEDPAAWLERVAHNARFLGDVVLQLGRHAISISLILAAGLLAMVVLLRRRSSSAEADYVTASSNGGAPASDHGDRAMRRQVPLLAAVLVAQAAFPALVLGYGKLRYWSLVVFVALLAACLFAAHLGRVHNTQSRKLGTVFAAAFTTVLVAGLLVAGPLAGEGDPFPTFDEQADRGAALGACVARDERVLVLAEHPGVPLPYALGALGGQRTAVQPHNLNRLQPSETGRLISDYGVRHVLLATGDASQRRALDRLNAAQGGGRALSREPCSLALYRVR